MKFIIRIAALILLSACIAHAQGSAVNDIAILNSGGALRAVPGATITVCTLGAVGLPCNLPLTIYSNITLTMAIGTSMTADANGNYSYFIAPADYTETTTATGVAGKSITRRVPGLGGGGGGAGTVTNTNGALTSGHVSVGNGGNDLRADTGCTTDFAGDMVCITYKSPAFVSSTTTPAVAGIIRMSSLGGGGSPNLSLDAPCWRNAANSQDYCIYKLAAAFGNIPVDTFAFNGVGVYAQSFSGPFIDTSITGAIRLSGPHGDRICWRNQGNSADLCLSLSGGNALLFNGLAIGSGGTGPLLGATDAVNTAPVLGGTIYGNATPFWQQLPGPTAQNAVNYFLTEQASAGVAQAPSWQLASFPIDPRTTVTEAIAGASPNCTDRGSLVTFNNAGAIAATIAQSGTGCVTNSFYWEMQDLGAGTVTLTATTSTFTCTPTTVCSGSVLTLLTGQYATCRSNNVNYFCYVILAPGLVVCKGTIALPTHLITAGTKWGATAATPLAVSCPGMLTSDNILLTPNADITSTTCYTPADAVTIISFPDSGLNQIDIYLENKGNSDITCGAATANFRGMR